MKIVLNILLFTFFVLCLFLFRPRQDVVFAAIDETQYIRLFKTGMDFELGIEDNNTYTGTYTIIQDTIYLSYRKEHLLAPGIDQEDIRRTLPDKLYINTETSNIEAGDGKTFSAKIYLDTRHKNRGSSSYSIRMQKNKEIQLPGGAGKQ